MASCVALGLYTDSVNEKGQTGELARTWVWVRSCSIRVGLIFHVMHVGEPNINEVGGWLC